MAFLPNMTNETKAVLMEMLQTGELCDIYIRAKDSVKVHNIHALVLASASSKLTKYCDRTSGVQNVVPFGEKVLEEVITLAYHGVCEITEDILEEAIEVSQSFKLDVMKNGCKIFLLKNVSIFNMIDYIRISKKLSGDPCSNQIIKFVARNIKDVEIDTAKTIPKEVISALLSNLSLNMTSEEATNFLNVWIEANRPVKSSFVKQLKSLAQIPSKRRIPKDVIIALGGWEHNPTGIIEYFNPLTKKWKKSKGISMPPQLGNITYCGFEVIGACLYVVGGYSSANMNTEGHYLASLFQFDLKQKTWTALAPMTTNRCYVSTAVCQDVLYAFGGRGSGQTADRLRSAEKFDIATNEWTEIANMQSRRSDFASTVYEGNILAIGGFNGDGWLNSIEKYNPQTNSWTTIAHMPSPRSGASTVTLGNKVYVLGGYDGANRLKSVECFSLGVGAINLDWHPVPDMIDCRSNFTACVVNKKIMVIGGFKADLQFSGVCKDVEMFDPLENVWTSAPKLNVARSALASVNCDNEFLDFK